MFRARIYKAKTVVAILAMLLFQGNVYSQSEFTQRNEDSVSDELRSLGQRGDKIARARQQALEILQTQNACAAWFQESDPDAAEVFRSLHYELDRQGTSHIVRLRTEFGVSHFKHPWGAKSDENAGRNSSIFLNAYGPFFARQSRVTDSAVIMRPTWHRLNVGFYDGDTNEARVAILLHELGHIIGRLPADNDSWDGRSSRNTLEVLQHCKSEIDPSGRKESRVSN
jgi:hypothetical protein